jgi:hypothetical protein
VRKTIEAVLLLVFASIPAFAQTPCTWAGQTSIIAETCGFVGIGTTAPATQLTVVSEFGGLTRGMSVDQYTPDVNGACSFLRKARGTLSAPSAVVNGDSLGSLYAYGYDGSGWTGGARVRFVADGNVSIGIVPTTIQFFTGTNTNGIERMRVSSAGNVGIGTTAPASPLHVFKDWNGYSPANILAGFDAYDDQSRLVLRRANGNAGAETQVVTNDIVGALQFRGWQSGGSFAPAASASISAIAGENFTGTGFGGWLMLNTTPVGATEVLQRITITPSGQVGIGVVPVNNSPYIFQVQGNANFAGTVTGTNIQAQYQDVAEWVPVAQEVAAGTVVVVATEATNTVEPSIRAYDTRVAGVVSAHPGLILGQESASKARIATTGRVKVRVDATRHPVAIGDLLVTSDKPGMAMLSEPLDLGGVKIHRPGTLIGKALEPLAGGEGQILVLLSLQ